MQRVTHAGRVYRVLKIPAMRETAAGQFVAAKPLSPQEQAEYRRQLEGQRDRFSPLR